MPDTLTEQIIGAAIEVHHILGPGLLEKIYQQALCIELRLRGIAFACEVDATVQYKGHELRGQRIDLLVAGEVIVEVKAVASLPDYATAQVLSYLKAIGLKRALLINFSAPRLVDGIKRLSL